MENSNKQEGNIENMLGVLIEKGDAIRNQFSVLDNKAPVTIQTIDDNEFWGIYDPDSSPIAWKYYEAIYGEVLKFKEGKSDNDYSYSPTQLIEKCQRLKFPPARNKEADAFWIQGRQYKRITGTFLYTKVNDQVQLTLAEAGLIAGKNIGIAGDCVFNFNEKKKNYFDKIIDDDKEYKGDKKNVKNILQLCCRMNHSPYNFSLMPITGGLQNVKGRYQADRPDRFLFNLEKFYKAIVQFELNGERINLKEKNNINLGNFLERNEDIVRCVGTNKALFCFLYTIGSMNEYCKLFYHLQYNDGLLAKMIDNGRTVITKCDELLHYIELAVQYWQHQATHYNKMKGNADAKTQNSETEC